MQRAIESDKIEIKIGHVDTRIKMIRANMAMCQETPDGYLAHDRLLDRLDILLCERENLAERFALCIPF